MSSRDEKRSGLPWTIWAGILAWVVLAILAVVWGVPNEENDLTDRAGELLTGTGLSVDFSGRDATITGTADQATIDATADAVYGMRGVRRVDTSDTQTAAPPTTTTTTTTTTTAATATRTTAAPETTTTTAAPEDPSFIATGADGKVDLRGILPDQDIIDSIEAAAMVTYGAGNVVNELEVGGVADSADLAYLSQVFEVAEGLNSWELSLEDGEVSYSGTGPDEETVAAKRDLFADYVSSFASAQGAIELDATAVASSFTELLALGANFESGSAVLSEEAKSKLDEIIEIMMENPSAVLTVEGHTDSQGDAADNQALSEARAQAVVDYLVDGGIAADRLTAVGYGEDRPIASNDTAEGRAENRRIEFVVTEGE